MNKLYKSGNKNLLTSYKTAFLCSRLTPESYYKAVLQWVYQLSPDRDCILCGNHSYAEQKVFTLLLQLKIPTILVLAEAMKTQWNNDIENAFKENRLLIITSCDETVHRVSKQSAADRNRLILSLSDTIVIGYCSKGGNIERQITNLTNVRFLSPEPFSSAHTEKDSPSLIQESHNVCVSANLTNLSANLTNLSTEHLTNEKKEQPPKKKYTLEEKRQQYGNAYLPWEERADEYLIHLYDEGKSIKELTEIFERNRGSITSRLKKLGKLP